MQLRGRLVLHAYPHLVRQYGLGGLHLTGAQRAAATHRPALLPGQKLSTSFHSLAEISRHCRRYDYVFLSPVFDSISKVGYVSHFNLPTVQVFLQKLAARPGCRPPVLALGEVTANALPWRGGWVLQVWPCWARSGKAPTRWQRFGPCGGARAGLYRQAMMA